MLAYWFIAHSIHVCNIAWIYANSIFSPQKAFIDPCMTLINKNWHAMKHKAPTKRSQHFNATYRNIVGCNLLRAFGHLVATCCDMLQHVGCFQHLWTLHVVVVVWPGSSSNVAPGHVTSRNTLQQGGQKRATCCAQQCCELLCSNVAIVWPEIANAGPTMLGYVALRCCYRLGGA